MADQQDIHAAETPQDQPTMELLDGAEAAPAARSSLAARVVRGSLYGVLLLSATALLAISAVPELANYVSFIPDDRAQGTCHLSSGVAGTCATLDVADLENIKGTPCSALSAVAADESGCAKSKQQCASLASVSAETAACCAAKTAAAETAACCAKGASTVAAASCEKSASGCEKSGCPLAVAAASADASEEQPLDETQEDESDVSVSEVSDTPEEPLE